MLGTSRILFQGETPYAHEREALDFVINALPNTDPYHLWGLVDLLDPSTGRLLEIDLIVLGYNAIYLVEIKSGPGRYQGDYQDWYRTPPGGTPRYMDNPRKLTNLKAKVLKGLLDRKMKKERCPWIEPLIFLSHPEIKLDLAPNGRTGVVTRETFLKAVKHHDFPGVAHSFRSRPIAKPVTREVVQAMAAIGLTPRKGKAFAGTYELGSVLEEGEGFQDREATHRDQQTFKRRARTYLVPQQTSVERRQQLRRAADREAQLLWDVRDHAHILRFADYVTDAQLGPTVLFDDFDGIPLDAFLRQHKDLEFLDRVTIIEQIGRALGYCHRKGIVHGGLSPQAVLVRRDKSIETRLFNFQLGASAEVEPTIHRSALTEPAWALYQAPELREDPTAHGALSDIFSLGALAYFVFTGRAPGETVVEVDLRLKKERHLDPRDVEDVHEKIADLVILATELAAAQRADNVDEWIELLLTEATAEEPIEEEPELDPLKAAKGDILGDDLLVKRVLGHGATSHVLEVDRDGKDYALKISLSPDHDERLEAEAVVLRKLRHQRIVQLVDEYTFAGRRCLLLSLAGNETLHRYLAREGTVSLDLACRYGEDLLSVLEHFEDEGVMHRDIKPANLGVGRVGKVAAHLVLFDFSLAKASPTDLAVGTTAYRDPFLSSRGKWDYAAERYSAAVTLHEMLTGMRPSYGGRALDETAELQLAAERFDPSARDRLSAFFERALARDAEARFPSAESMRHAWVSVFEPSIEVSKPDTTEDLELTPTDGLSDEQVTNIAPDALIGELPLSLRARNALDRAGLGRAEELLDLADNRLSTIRGIGTAVAREILDFRKRWSELRTLTPKKVEPFFPGYRGEEIHVITSELEAPVATALRDGGLCTLSIIAAAPASQVTAIAERAKFDAKVVHHLLELENKKANERAHPSTLEGWVKALLPDRKSMRHPRALFGIDEPFVGRLNVSVKELAKHAGVTAPAIYIAMGKRRVDWAKHKALDELRTRCVSVVESGGGAMPLDQASEALQSSLPHERNADAKLLLARGAALFRVVTEVDKEEPNGLCYVRLHDDVPWIFASDEHVRVVRALGEAADRLADRPVLASPGEAARAFAEIVADTPLSSLSPERRAELAAAASKKAARSTRLEIYPKGMPADRALGLTASVLGSDLSPEEVRQRVASRYPKAATLPERPDLDTLVEAHGLTFNEIEGKYHRKGPQHHTTLATQFSSMGTRAPTAHPDEALSMEPGPVAARQFVERLRNALERRKFRALSVNSAKAQEAALRLAEIMGTEPVAFDRLLIEHIRKQMEKGGVKKEDVIHDADREGPSGRSWHRLSKLVQKAAESLEAELLPPLKPLLLVQPGLIARYKLEGFLKRLMETSKSPDAEAIFLLIPSHDTDIGLPRINGELPIPGLLDSQALRVSREWLNNQHKKAAQDN